MVACAAEDGLDTERLIAQILVRHSHTRGGLLPALQDIQEDLGFIPVEALPAIAAAFNLSAAEVRGVISFYHDFRTQPAGRHIVRVCQAESCQACGSRSLTAHIESRLGVRLGETRADGEVTLLPVYCLGNCARSPALQINTQGYAGVDTAGFDALLDELLADVSA